MLKAAGHEKATEETLRRMIDATNDTFGQLGVSVSTQRRPVAATAECGGCFKPIHGSAVAALNKHFHPQCFDCYKCHDVIGSDSFVVRTNTKGEQIAVCDACIEKEKRDKASAAASVNHGLKATGTLSTNPTNNKTTSTTASKFGSTTTSNNAGSSSSSSSSNTTSSSANTGSSGLSAAARQEFLSNRDQGKVGANLTCVACEQAIGIEDEFVGSIAYTGKAYHTYCFVCGHCGQPIRPNDPFKEMDENAYHPQCIQGGTVSSHNPNGTSNNNCAKCNKFLDGKFVKLDGKSYHSACFVCSHCSCTLSSAFVSRGNETLCNKCADKTRANPTIEKNTQVIGAGIRFDQVTREVKIAPGYPGTTSSATTTASSSTSSGTSKFCTSCGTAATGSKFCSSCGSKM